MTTDLLTPERVQERKSGIWDYVSPSRLNLWLKCPLAFRLRYVDGIVTPPSPSQFVGKVVHTGLETWYRHRQLGMPLSWADLSCRLRESWGAMAVEEGVAFSDQIEESTCRAQAVGLVKLYLARLPANEPRPLAVELAVEAPLIDPVSGENLGIPLLGILDLVLAESAGPLIADFKTAARGGEPLDVTHEIQLTSYSYLFRHYSPEPEAALEIRSLVKTKIPKVEFHPYPRRTGRHFRRLFAVVRAYLDALDSGRYHFRPSFSCASCEFRETYCRNWEDSP